MKYTSLKNIAQKSRKLQLSDKGVKNSKNVWSKNSILQTRPAVSANLQGVIGENIPKSADVLDYILTDTAVYIDGKYHRIAYVNATDSNSAWLTYVYLIDELGEVRSIGYMPFTRTDASVYYIPENITFYVGKALGGGGIYALITLVNMMDFESRKYHIYEIDESLTEWQPTKDYYVPTVYINGRGNQYDMAKQQDIAVEAAPKELEALNMLNGRFYAYYSSDSNSSSFKLPFSQLSDDVVRCRVYVDSKTYSEWSLAADTNKETVRFCNQDVTVELDREKGVIYFYSEGYDYAIPQMSSYKENNIQILATKEIPEAFKRVASCKQCTVFNSKIVFSGGLCGNEIYYTQFDNPLYFPQISNNKVGSPMNEITALAGLEEKIIAFKGSEMYSVELQTPKPLNTTNILIDNPAIFYIEKDLKIKNISDTIGCLNKYSISKINGHLIWQAPDGKVLAYSGNTVYTLLDDVKAYFKEWGEDEFAVSQSTSFDGHCIFMLNNKAVVMDFANEKEKIWHAWEFPVECNICGAFSFNNKPVLLCADSNKKLCYTANFNGERDVNLSCENGEIKETLFDINTEIKSENVELCELGKEVKIAKVYLRLKAKDDVKIRLCSGENFCDFKCSKTDFCCKEENTVILRPNFKCENAVSLTVGSKMPLKISEAVVYFTGINGGN